MNLFVWGQLKDRRLLSFILRRTYMGRFEPCQLYGYMVGTNWKDRLFAVGGSHPDLMIEGDIAPELSTSDIVKLDYFHALEDSIYRRDMQPVKVLRAGNIVQVPVFVYSAGMKFSNLNEGELWPEKGI